MFICVKLSFMAEKEVKTDKELLKNSYSQTLKIPNQLHQRAIKYENFSGVKVTEQLRHGLSDFLTKNNF